MNSHFVRLPKKLVVHVEMLGAMSVTPGKYAA
jgi:hypothetical protein